MRFYPLFLTISFLGFGATDAKLTIGTPIFHQYEDGPLLPANSPFQPGDSVFFSCQVDGYKKSEDDKIALAWHVESRDSQGVLVVAADDGKLVTDLAPEDKKWMPKIRTMLVIPPMADSGEYHILVKVHDALANTDAELRASFTVVGRKVDPSDKLVVRNFRWLRTEEDKDPIAVAAYRPGDTMWARFDMTGYKLGDKNDFDVEYGLKILKPTGETAFEQPQAAQQKSATFYPQRYTPGILSLNIPKDMQKAGYTMVLMVRDNLGGQTVETSQKFSVE